jgi:dUTP pyrophosphatase
MTTQTLTIAIKPLHPKAKIPHTMSEWAAGYDLYAACDADVTIRPGERKLIPVGFALELPQGVEAQIRPRSGLAHKAGITVLNAPGTIDADYRGEIKILLINLGQEAHTIIEGDRIAQMLFSVVQKVHFELKTQLSSTERGQGGFGSTGLNEKV